MKNFYKCSLLFCLLWCLLLPDFVYSQPIFPMTACDENPVLSFGHPGEWDSDCVFLPYLFFENDTSFLIYTGSIDIVNEPTSIGYAYADDGINFGKYPDLIFSGDGTGFDAMCVSRGIVIKSDNEYIMYYNGRPNIGFGPGRFIGRATANNLNGPWSRLDDPVVQAGGGSQWDYMWDSPSSVIEVDSGYFMYFQGMDWFPNGTGQIGLAYSPDGINWQKYDDPLTTEPLYSTSDPVLFIGEPGSWDDICIWGCSVIKTDYGFEMFYAAEGFQGRGIGYAHSIDGINWEKDTIGPIYYASDDPYAVAHLYSVITYPGVYLNEDEFMYYVYYDYGPGFGEIGLATVPLLGIGLSQIKDDLSIKFEIYPNPCSGTTCLRYLIHDIGYLISDLFDISGRKIRELVNGDMMPGTYEVEVDVSDLPAGVYFIRVQAGNDVAVQKLLVVE